MHTTTPKTNIPVHLARRAGVELELRRHALRTRALRGDRGQGTVEYVALILLVGAILSAVVASGAGKNFNIGKTIGEKLAGMINEVGGKK